MKPPHTKTSADSQAGGPIKMPLPGVTLPLVLPVGYGGQSYSHPDPPATFFSRKWKGRLREGGDIVRSASGAQWVCEDVTAVFTAAL